jgi:zinc D-Ala-D-Ala dipeptidase
MRRGYFWVLSIVAMVVVLMIGWQGRFPGVDASGPMAIASTPPSVMGSAPSLLRVQASDYRLLDIQTIVPDIAMDMRYATTNNFLKQAVYSKARCLLREPVARSVMRAHESLKAQGYGLKMLDCYRPLSVQKAMWKIFPDARYVANPVTGSRHNRGAAVDLSLVDAQGRDLEMPSEFDDFSERAHRNAQTMTPTARKHVKILTDALEAQGMTTIATEWWHYDGPNWRHYGILDQSL